MSIYALQGSNANRKLCERVANGAKLTVPPDLIRGKFDPEAPVSQEITDGLVHRLYRIKGEFKNDFKLQDYPFDAQRLTIRLVNTRLTRDQVVYAVDSVGLRPSVTPKNILHRDPQMFQQWRLQAVNYFRDDLVQTSTLGDPRAFHSKRTLELPGFKAVLDIQRRSVIFLVKNLLPLGLLSMVLYSTLFFPENLLKERVTVPVASMGTVNLAPFATRSHNFQFALEP